MNSSIDVDQLSTLCGGSGSPAIFIHGFGSSKYTWRHVCHGVEDILSYYAIDLPGSGTSPAPDTFLYSLENFSEVITDFILKKDLRDLTLVGTSFGGGAVLMALLRNPEKLATRVRSLCLVDGIAYPQPFPFYIDLLRTPLLGSLMVNLVPFQLQAWAVLAYCYFDDSLITREQIDEYASYFKRSAVRVALRQTARLIDQKQLTEYVNQLPNITIPCLLVWGRQDEVVPLKIGQRLASELPRSQLVVVDRCGHMPQEERPREVIVALRKFIQSSTQ